MSHLTDTQLQSLADGTLRGPEGMGAREHCEECAECGAELSIYTALGGQLSTLRDPEPPADFTATVLAAVQVREAQLVTRRHTLLAAIPAHGLERRGPGIHRRARAARDRGLPLPRRGADRALAHAQACLRALDRGVLIR
jgi:anti-sigma factor ChrR (cupin superfamily)